MPTYPILKDADSLSSPGLWVDREAAQRNIARMIADIGGPDQIERLRPHVKTHKMLEVVALQVAAGITKYKAATPAEARMAALGGATDILMAHQLAGPKIHQVAELIQSFPGVSFSVIVDDAEVLETMRSALRPAGRPLSIWIDVDCGMHRTGTPFGPALDALRSAIESAADLKFEGLHAYDGHLNNPSLEIRQRGAREVIESARTFITETGPCRVVGGGSPTFHVWAGATDWECSPGTTLLWDSGYGENFPDLPYEVAAGLVTRIISKPGDGLLCFDLGHKSVAAEMELPLRAVFPEIRNCQLVSQSEEHLVLRVPDASEFKIGRAFTAIPRHICPTVALHAYASIVKNGKPTGERWRVAARDRF